jgi:RNA polymerase sigma factor for flagellar operon FliA
MYSRAEVSNLVRRAVSELPPRDAQIVALYHFEGKSMDAIARELNIDKSWVSRVHARAMARLTERLGGLE